MSQRKREKLIFFSLLGLCFIMYAIRYQAGW